MSFLFLGITFSMAILWFGIGYRMGLLDGRKDGYRKGYSHRES